jgi:hypothetical protein
MQDKIAANSMLLVPYDLKGRCLSGDIDINGMILKWILEKQGVKVQTVFIWVTVEPSDRL